MFPYVPLNSLYRDWCVLAHRVHGKDGLGWYSGAHRALALGGDAAGVERWHEMPTVYEKLLRGEGRA